MRSKFSLSVSRSQSFTIKTEELSGNAKRSRRKISGVSGDCIRLIRIGTLDRIRKNERGNFRWSLWDWHGSNIITKHDTEKNCFIIQFLFRNTFMQLISIELQSCIGKIAWWSTAYIIIPQKSFSLRCKTASRWKPLSERRFQMPKMSVSLFAKKTSFSWICACIKCDLEWAQRITSWLKRATLQLSLFLCLFSHPTWMLFS